MGEVFDALGAFGPVLLIVAVFAAVVLFSAVKVVQEYERGVVFRLGRLLGPRGPGLILLIPFVERMQKVDLRTVTMDIPAQEVITRDNVTVRVNAVAYFRVLDPNAATVNVADYIRATSQIAQTTLRSVLGQSSLDDLLSEREKINLELQQIIDQQTEPWGVKVSIVEVKDVETLTPHGAVASSMICWRIVLIFSRSASSSSRTCCPRTERSVVCAICDVATMKFSTWTIAAAGSTIRK